MHLFKNIDKETACGKKKKNQYKIICNVGNLFLHTTYSEFVKRELFSKLTNLQFYS